MTAKLSQGPVPIAYADLDENYSSSDEANMIQMGKKPGRTSSDKKAAWGQVGRTSSGAASFKKFDSNLLNVNVETSSPAKMGQGMPRFSMETHKISSQSPGMKQIGNPKNMPRRTFTTPAMPLSAMSASELRDNNSMVNRKSMRKVNAGGYQPHRIVYAQPHAGKSLPFPD